MVKNPPGNAGVAEVAVLIPGQEDPLEKEMAVYASILAWEIPWTEKPGGLQSMGSQESNRTEHRIRNSIHLITSQRLYLQTPSLWGLGFNL